MDRLGALELNERLADIQRQGTQTQLQLRQNEEERRYVARFQAYLGIATTVMIIVVMFWVAYFVMKKIGTENFSKPVKYDGILKEHEMVQICY